MPANPFRLALTADLHWGINPAGDACTRQLVDLLRETPPDLLILAGDVGAGEDFARCLTLFGDLACRKALVPGNHDVWVNPQDARGDSLQVYEEYLPRQCAKYGFHYLDAGPLLYPESGLAVVGSMNWYDYSWSLEALNSMLPDWEERLQSKRFERGRHNDARFVRWPLTDILFTARAVATLERQLQEALAQVESAIVVTHHPAFFGLNFPREHTPPTIDGLLWDAFSGNRALEEVLRRHQDHIRFVFSGHTHRARENTLGSIRGYNLGGDYHFKRMLFLDWPTGTIEQHEFHAKV